LEIWHLSVSWPEASETLSWPVCSSGTIPPATKHHPTKQSEHHPLQLGQLIASGRRPSSRIHQVKLTSYISLTLWYTNSLLLKMAIYGWFTYEKWWFPIVMLVYRRVPNFFLYVQSSRI
jgi:hypothetical protein